MRFKSSQIKAAIKVNDEMIRFYWSLGHDMDEKKVTYSWRSHFYAQISADLKKELPDVKSFSPRNLLYMHQFYRLFPITQQLVSQNDIDNEIFLIFSQPLFYMYLIWKEVLDCIFRIH